MTLIRVEDEADEALVLRFHMVFHPWLGRNVWNGFCGSKILANLEVWGFG